VPEPGGDAKFGPKSGRRKSDLRDVSFKYPGSEQAALEHINLHLTPGGEVLALVGGEWVGEEDDR